MARTGGSIGHDHSEKRLEEVGIGALLAALTARDAYSGKHAQAVHDLSQRVAHRLELPEHDVDAIKNLALLYNIGKIGVPDAVLRKREPLNAQEWRTLRQAPLIGSEIASAIPALSWVAPAIRSSHERWDGNGYPDGLAGEDIPISSRIVFACASYLAMISNRPYRRALPQEEARRQLWAHGGSQFDPRVVTAILEVLGQSAVAPDSRATLPESLTNVVIIDDDAATRLLLRFTLESDGLFRIVGEAGHGAEAINVITDHKPDAIVLDLAMPVMGGLQLLPKLRAVSPDTKIVVYSASDPPEIFAEAEALGADVCLEKGLPLTEVEYALQVLCSKARLEEATFRSRGHLLQLDRPAPGQEQGAVAELVP